MNYYIRRGDIPKDERSTIGKGFGEGRIIIGYEKGVSCWRAIKDGDRWTVCYPANPTEHTFADFQSTVEKGYRSIGKLLLITGDEVGFGSDGEPLLINVKIIKELDEDKEFIKGV